MLVDSVVDCVDNLGKIFMFCLVVSYMTLIIQQFSIISYFL